MLTEEVELFPGAREAVPEESRDRFFEIASLAELPALVERIAEDSGARSQDSGQA